MQASSTQAYRSVSDQLANDASFLWLLRSVVVNRPNYNSQDLSILDQRVDAQLDGLMTSPEESWEICLAATETGEPGEIFTAAMLAFRSLDAIKIQQAVEAGLVNDEATKGLISALGWLPGRLVHSWIKKFLTSKNLDHKYLAIAACSIRRENPLDYLTKIFQRDDCIAHTKLYARALRLVGELKRHDLMPALRIAMRSDKPEVLFWAKWSAILLGDVTLVNDLQPFVMTIWPQQKKAIDLAFRVLPIETGRAWIILMSKNPAQARNVITATATLGDPHAINWLISQMRVPILTRLAGEAFTTITGIDLDEHNLAINGLPNLDHQLPNDNPADDNTDMDEDEHLPFPDADKIVAVWQKYQHRFTPAERYLMGKTIGVEHLLNVISNAHQRQRKAAALELSLLQTAQFLINHAAKDLSE